MLAGERDLGGLALGRGHLEAKPRRGFFKLFHLAHGFPAVKARFIDDDVAVLLGGWRDFVVNGPNAISRSR